MFGIQLINRVSKYGRRIFVDVVEMPESDVVVHSKDQDIHDWLKVALQIEKNYEKYHGFVVLHGTDTMAYLSSALSFMFENLGKSVIFTGSQVSERLKLTDSSCYHANTKFDKQDKSGASYPQFYNQRKRHFNSVVYLPLIHIDVYR